MEKNLNLFSNGSNLLKLNRKELALLIQEQEKKIKETQKRIDLLNKKWENR